MAKNTRNLSYDFRAIRGIDEFRRTDSGGVSDEARKITSRGIIDLSENFFPRVLVYPAAAYNRSGGRPANITILRRTATAFTRIGAPGEAITAWRIYISASIPCESVWYSMRRRATAFTRERTSVA